MSTWRRLTVELFPDHTEGWDGFQRPHVSIYQVFFRLKEDVVEHIRSDNRDALTRIFRFVEWCFAQRNRNGDIWNAAATAFLEHLADSDEGAAVIPYWVKPEIFEDMREEFEKRRERDGPGKFQKLLDDYNRVNATDFR